MYQVNTRWAGDLAFDSEVQGHTLRIDGNDGPSPKRLLLTSLAGCTGMDVVSLLQKMRVPFTDLEIYAEADLTEEHPKVFSEIRLVYRISGEGLDAQKVEKAIKLSQEKYCGVSEMLRKNSPIHYRIEYISE